MQWTEEQRLAIESRDANILVAAAAGSGKTAVLVERIIQRVLDQTDPLNIDEILVATFTNAAAEEMRNRIASALEHKMEEDPRSSHLKKQLALIQRSYISTLHSFCTTVVRQYSYLIDIDPSFRIGDEMEMDLIKQDILDELFEEMRNRIASALEHKMEEDPRSSHLKKQLALIQRSYISTLHSFCTTVVRQYSYLIDIDPSFRIGDEMEMDLIKQDILDELFEE